MSAVVADTHAAIWYLSSPIRLSRPARAAMNRATQTNHPIYISSITLVEVIYLVEKGRLPATALHRLTDALSDQDSAYVLVPIDDAIANTVQEIPRTSVPDMPDRIIAATAYYLGLYLVSRDSKIRATNLQTIW